MIPKVIHLLWFGGGEKSELVKCCIKSWSTYCPDFQIRVWDDSDLEFIDNQYLQEAFRAKKWAFVSDFMRLYALKTEGGFYFDTDLELTANIDEFCHASFVGGIERSPTKNHFAPMTAFLGSEANGKIITEFLDEYSNLKFDNKGTLDTTPNTIRFARYLSRAFGTRKPDYSEGLQTITLGSFGKLYPYYFFCTPLSQEKNFAIHHFDGSWIASIKRSLILSFGSFQLIKLSFKDKNAVLAPSLNEKIIWSFEPKGSKKRIFQIIRRITSS